MPTPRTASPKKPDRISIAGKGRKHRIVPLPRAMEEDLSTHIAALKSLHDGQLILGQGAVHIPTALKRKYSNAPTEFAWQYLFPAARLCAHPRSGEVARHHLHEKSLQNQFKNALRKTTIYKKASCHTRRRLLKYLGMKNCEAFWRLARRFEEAGLPPRLRSNEARRQEGRNPKGRSSTPHGAAADSKLKKYRDFSFQNISTVS